MAKSLAGKKDQSLSIQRRTRVPNNAGGWVDSWPTLVTIWASVIAKAGRESMQEARPNAVFINLFTIWRDDCPTLSEVDRILWNGENWNIRTVRREGARQLETVVEAERGVAS